jgi:hypothetical protein
MVYNPEDLDDLEVALLGALCVGLPPSRSAGDDSFRVDYVTAVISGLQTSGRHELHLLRDGATVSPAFAEALRGTIDGLVEKGIVARPPVGMPAAPGMFEAGLEVDVVRPDEQPAVLDRYLAQACMERLFNNPAVYPFLMERYTASGEVWRKLREGGYAN